MSKALTSTGIGEQDFIPARYPGIRTLRSSSTLHFTGAIAKNGSETENLTGLRTNKIKITRVTLFGSQALHYRILFFSKDTFTNTDLDLDKIIGEIDLDFSIYSILKSGNLRIFENYVSGGDTNYSLNLGSYVAQTFTTKVSQRISSISIWARRGYFGDPVPRAINISIRATDSNGKPTGNDLTSASMWDTNLNDPGGSYKELIFDGSSPTALTPINLVANTKYALLVTAAVDGSQSYMSVDGTDATYSGGQIYTSADGGSTWASVPTADALFKTQGDFWPYVVEIRGLDLPYEDLDGTKELHVMLVNLSPTSKLAGSSGAVVLEAAYQSED